METRAEHVAHTLPPNAGRQETRVILISESGGRCSVIASVPRGLVRAQWACHNDECWSRFAIGVLSPAITPRNQKRNCANLLLIPTHQATPERKLTGLDLMDFTPPAASAGQLSGVPFNQAAAQSSFRYRGC